MLIYNLELNWTVSEISGNEMSLVSDLYSTFMDECGNMSTNKPKSLLFPSD